MTVCTAVDGGEGLDGLQSRVDGGHAAAAFALPAVTVEQIMLLADRGALLPPKVRPVFLRTSAALHLVVRAGHLLQPQAAAGHDAAATALDGQRWLLCM